MNDAHDVMNAVPEVMNAVYEIESPRKSLKNEALTNMEQKWPVFDAFRSEASHLAKDPAKEAGEKERVPAFTGTL